MTDAVTVNGSRGSSPERTLPRTGGLLDEDLDRARCCESAYGLGSLLRSAFHHDWPSVAGATGSSSFKYRDGDKMASVDWIADNYGWVISGPQNKPRLKSVAMAAWQQMETKAK